MKKNCLNCNNEMINKNQYSKKYWANRKFCNKKCQKGFLVKHKKSILCNICGKDFRPLRKDGTEISEKQFKNYKSCSKECLSKLHSKLKKGRISNFLGKHHSEESKRKMSKTGKETNIKYWLGKKRSIETIEKIKKAKIFNPLRHTDETKLKIKISLKGRVLSKKSRLKISSSKLGKKNPMWKGGVTPRKKHGTKKYRLWRTSVFRRDKYTCQECGKKNCKLNAHHILWWSKFPKLRYNIKNGLTLCLVCHKAKHSKK